MFIELIFLFGFKFYYILIYYNILLLYKINSVLLVYLSFVDKM